MINCSTFILLLLKRESLISLISFAISTWRRLLLHLHLHYYICRSLTRMETTWPPSHCTHSSTSQKQQRSTTSSPVSWMRYPWCRHPRSQGRASAPCPSPGGRRHSPPLSAWNRLDSVVPSAEICSLKPRCDVALLVDMNHVPKS